MTDANPFTPSDDEVALVAKRFVADAVPVKKLVEVALVVVVLPKSARAILLLVENRFVLLAVVAKKLVVVAALPVALMKVKF